VGRTTAKTSYILLSASSATLATSDGLDTFSASLSDSNRLIVAAA
jgi:hypothetical protein